MAITPQSLIPGANISASALSAERSRMEIVANNLANAHSSGADASQVYKRRVAVFDAVFNDQLSTGKDPASELGGVKLKEIAVDESDPTKLYSPGHPNADKSGMVTMPNVSVMEEMLDMITATRAYEANLNALTESRRLTDRTINMFKG